MSTFIVFASVVSTQAEVHGLQGECLWNTCLFMVSCARDSLASYPGPALWEGPGYEARDSQAGFLGSCGT